MSTVIEEAHLTTGRTTRRDEVDAAQLVPVLLSVAKSVRTWSGIMLEGAGVAPGQDAFFLALGDGKPKSVRAVAEALAIRPSTVSKMVDILARKGMASRSVDRTDARHVMVALTADGIAVSRRVAAVHGAMEADLMRDLRGDDKDVLVALRQLEDVLAARLRRLR